MKAYKGFNKDMTCKGFQYEEGKEYETDTAKCCDSGFHACEYPLDCLKYYYPNTSVYHEVELDGTIDEGGKQGSKVCATKIRIGKELSTADMVKAAIDYTVDRTNPEAKADERRGASSATGNRGASSATGYYGASSATGDYGASSATGDYGASSATGNRGASSATGYYGASSATGCYGASSATGDYGASSATGCCGASSATGYCGASSATGDYGASSATGDYGASSATGCCGASSATGDYGASSATGDCSTATVTGYQSVAEAWNETAVAVAWGHESTAKGCIGAYLVLTDWEYIGELNEDGKYDEPYDKNNWKLNGAKLVQVDGVIIKANTPYRCVNGEVKEAE